jgi:DNA-binding NarL/FixJ family response regulator
MIRVALADDHPIVLDGIALALDEAPDVRVVGRAADAAGALQLARDVSPDVIVLDFELPGASAFETLRELKRIRPELRVVIFSAYGGSERIAQAFEHGADSYVLKGTPSDELLSAIRAVSRGETHIPSAVAKDLVGAMRASARERLTDREAEILRLIARGMANKEIAAELDISERTVKFHVSEILARLNVANRAHAVAVARERGLL